MRHRLDGRQRISLIVSNRQSVLAMAGLFWSLRAARQLNRQANSMAHTAGHALIIEDEMLIALEVESLLEEIGYASFDIAESPCEALRCARNHRPDLITADLRIIGGTGLEAVRDIHAELGRIPVVYVTGNPDLVRAEADAQIVDKPIAPTALAKACALARAPRAA